MGRPFISNSGTVKLWHAEVVSSENSQHLSDWYSFSHIVHGFLLFFLLWLISKKIPQIRKFSVGFVIAVVIESIWEVIENTNFVIYRYREATIALDYFGDSIINSTADILFMSLGFMMASRLSVLASVSFVAGSELLLAIVIRDNLALNILMLIYPIDAIKEWQIG
jgi:multisubunit Na+/H+ antiporter MnhE subunit